MLSALMRVRSLVVQVGSSVGIVDTVVVCGGGKCGGEGKLKKLKIKDDGFARRAQSDVE
jgi:hypothetical protein